MKTIRRFFSLSAAEFALRGGRFLLFLASANAYGEEIIGAYGYYTAIFSVLFVLGDFGISQYTTQKLAENGKHRHHLLILLFIRILLVLSIFLLTTLFLCYMGKPFTWMLISVALLFLSDTFTSGTYAILRAQERFNLEVGIKYLVSLFYASSIILVYFMDASTLFLLLSFAVFLIGMTFYFSQCNPLPVNSINFLELTQHLKKSFGIYLGALFSLLYLRLDIIMLEYYTNLNETGFYTMASRFFELALIVPMVITIYLLPRISRTQEKLNFQSLLQNTVIGLIVFILFWFLSEPLVYLLLGEHFSTSLVVLKILLLGIPILLVNNYLFTHMVATNHAPLYAKITGLMVLVNFILNMVFIPTFGTIAAALSTLATEFIGMACALIYFYMNFRKSHAK